jgi:hypothetical protein
MTYGCFAPIGCRKQTTCRAVPFVFNGYINNTNAHMTNHMTK